MKYIMLRISHKPDLVEFFPILFSECGVHALVAQAATTMKFGTKDKWVRGEVVSAGFVEFDMDGQAKTYGSSESTGLTSHPNDAAIISCGESLRFLWPPREGCRVWTPRRIDFVSGAS